MSIEKDLRLDEHELEQTRRRFEALYANRHEHLKAGEYTVGSLLKLAQTNTLVHTVLQMWRHGQFPSFELALVAMVMELAKQNTELFAEFLKADAAKSFTVERRIGADATKTPT